jgi:Secretion system C-terminal sorting domain
MYVCMYAFMLIFDINSNLQISKPMKKIYRKYSNFKSTSIKVSLCFIFIGLQLFVLAQGPDTPEEPAGVAYTEDEVSSLVVCGDVQLGCNLFANGFFESGAGCGYINEANPYVPSLVSYFDCIHSVAGTPDRYSRSCANNTYDIPNGFSNDFNTTNDVYNADPNNNHYIGLRGNNGAYKEAIISQLAQPLQTGNYTISFYAMRSTNLGLVAPNVSIYAVNGDVAWQGISFVPVGTLLASQTINTATEIWTYYTFIVSVTGTFSHLVIANNNPTNFSYVGIDDFTITSSVNQGTINAGPDFNISCGQSIVVNPVITCCTNQNWSFQITPPSGIAYTQTSQSFIVNTPGTYTINFIRTINGVPVVVATDVIVVGINPAPCPPGDLTWNSPITLNSVGFVNQDIAVNADIIIAAGGPVIFRACDLSFATNKKITVQNGGILKIYISSLKSCVPCALMWEGIVVDNGGTLIIEDSNVKDANAAVQTTAVPLGYTGTLIQNITINRILFNKNTHSVWLRSHPKKISFTFLNNVITCRNLPNVYQESHISSTAWIADYNVLKQNLLNNDNFYPHGQTLLGVRSDIGIRIDSQTASNAVTIGEPIQLVKSNIIDYQHYGTQITNSKVSLYNNNFQFHIKDGDGVTSTAVYAPTTGNTNVGIIKLSINLVDLGYENYFTDNYNGVDLDKQLIVDIQRNSFNNSSTNSNIGKNGIFVKNTSQYVFIERSTLVNFENAIQVSRNTLTPVLNASFSIKLNNIDKAGAGFCNFGIFVRDVVNSIAAPPSPPNTVSYNYIMNVKNGITISNIKNSVICYNNNVTILNPNTSTNVYAIKFETCLGITATENNVGANTTNVPLNQLLRGFWVVGSQKCLLYCNNIHNTGRAIDFEGVCTSTNPICLKNNTLSKSWAGLVLSGGGVIGTQGSIAEAIEMNYVLQLGSFIGGQTRTELSNANLSKLYDFSANLPTNNINAGGTPYVLGTSLFPVGGTAPTTICLQVNEGEVEFTLTPEVAEQYAHTLTSLIDKTDSIIFDLPLQYEADKFVYNQVKDIALLSAVSDTLDIYGDSTLTDPIGRFRRVDDKILAGQYTQAQTINMNTIATNTKEVNQKKFNTIYLAAIANADYVISNSDKAVLNNIALQCYYNGGNAVIQSRNFLMAIEDRLIEFIDTCGRDSAFALPKNLKHINDECQNYVQNGRFSEYENCPEYATSSSPESFNAIGTKWKAFGGTPDYINGCSQNGTYIPYYPGGIQYPIDDSAFVGLLLYVPIADTSYKFEIIGNNLCDQLQSNEDYCTKLFVSCGEYSKYPTSSFGVYFAEDEFEYNSNFDVIVPQLINQSDNFLSDTGWVSLQWIYHAMGTEDVIGIGNFETQENTDTTTSQYDFSMSGETYVVVENVSIEKLTTVTGGGNVTITEGQSIQIGNDPTEVADYSWTNMEGDTVSTSQYPTVSPDSTTTYIVTKNQCNVLTTDTVTVFVSPTALAEIGTIGYFNLYPNPAKDAVNIYFQSGLEVTFELHDIAGKLIYSQVFPQGKNGYILPLNNYANGIYICNLKTLDGHQEQRKLMIER